VSRTSRRQLTSELEGDLWAAQTFDGGRGPTGRGDAVGSAEWRFALIYRQARVCTLRDVNMKILIPFAVLLGAIVVAAISYRRHRWEAPPHTRVPYPVLDGLTTLAVLGILVITLSPPGGRGGTRIHLLPLSDFWERDPHVDTLEPIIAAVANFILFIPLGFLVGVRWRLFDGWSSVLVLAAALSLAIEIIQFGLGGHDSSIDDVLLNTLGAMFGHGLMVIVRHWHPSRFTR
jgi:VanZ family protein